MSEKLSPNAQVVIIGGGSLGFAGGLTRDILSYKATSDAEFIA